MDTKLYKLRRDAEYMAKTLGELTRFPITAAAVIKLVNMIEKQEADLVRLGAKPAPTSEEA